MGGFGEFKDEDIYFKKQRLNKVEARHEHNKLISKTRTHTHKPDRDSDCNQEISLEYNKNKHNWNFWFLNKSISTCRFNRVHKVLGRLQRCRQHSLLSLHAVLFYAGHCSSTAQILKVQHEKNTALARIKNTGFQVLDPLIIFLPERHRRTFYRLRQQAFFKFQNNFQQIMFRCILNNGALLMCIQIWETCIRTCSNICAV